MRKSDVPLVGKPLKYYVFGCFMFLGYVLLLISEPDIRPGVVEAVLGVIVGFLAGIVLGSAWVARLPQLTRETARRPWMRWASLAVYPLPPLRAGFKYRLILGGLGFAAFFGLNFILEQLAQLWPNLGWPWARFGISQDDGLESAFCVSFLVTYVVLAVNGIRWYNGLPD